MFLLCQTKKCVIDCIKRHKHDATFQRYSFPAWRFQIPPWPCVWKVLWTKVFGSSPFDGSHHLHVHLAYSPLKWRSSPHLRAPRKWNYPQNCSLTSLDRVCRSRSYLEPEQRELMVWGLICAVRSKKEFIWPVGETF